MAVLAYAPLLLVWTAFVCVFFIAGIRAPKQKTVVSAPLARVGMAFQGVAFTMVCVRPMGAGAPAAGPVTWLAAAIGFASVLCAAAAKRHLGKQWRVNAALLADHDLVTSGPYAVVRHPIYASMAGMLLMTGLTLSRGVMLAAAIPVFLVGIEIRVRAEDRLLEDRFGDRFREYRKRVRAYIPFVR
jgi:protein-S-isoprenylcysteine O-methyltransferase Ste14